ncbi:NADH-dependent flavin oxidoreductase [Falsiroseomonas bella]|uniref:NADH-dependent flavin oxidoreductase n=1 Tax=Falsiroseomonas bella TaxID=2184016 RepID=A0A317FAU9_9PROT|nr:NADH-dependent flavin oxidoreductase [Falsiroseomonas bella]
MERYPAVFRPLRIGGVTLRNRILVPAHTTNYGEDNLPSDRHLAYHRARAAGGAALIIFEGIRVHRSSLGRRQGVNGYERAAIPRFARIAQAVQAEGARLFGQVIHLGRHIDGNFARMPAWSASAVPWSPTAPPPHPMTEAEIEQVIAAHGEVAANLVEAGLDGIELTMAHGHLLQQFLSPAVNRRSDAWGGSEENRLRLALECLRRVRGVVGGRAAVGLRVSADEFLEGGLTLPDMQRIVARLCAEVAVDFVNVSHSAYHGSYTISTQMADMGFAADAFHHLPRGIASALRDSGRDVPVFAVCRFRSVAEAEAMLADGAIAMVGMARAHIAEPALVRRAAEGREEEGRPCLSCNQGCAGFLAQSLAITCLANPRAGREAEWPEPPQPAAQRKRILVLGGGPAGMEAAIQAARRGHEVELWEAREELGGALAWTERHPALRGEMAKLLDWQRGALARAGVRLRLGRHADTAAVRAAGPDAVVLALGAEPAAAAFPGGGRGMTMEQALAAPDALPDRVAVQDVLGSFAVAGFVEWLAGTGRRVTVIAPTGTPGWQVNIYSSFAWRQRLRAAGARILALQAVQAWEGPGHATLTDLSTGEVRACDDFDAIVAPAHGLPRDSLAAELRAAMPELSLHLAGDCAAPRSALEAIFEGHEIGRSL